jgi:hypothetical protein
MRGQMNVFIVCREVSVLHNTGGTSPQQNVLGCVGCGNEGWRSSEYVWAPLGVYNTTHTAPSLASNKHTILQNVGGWDILGMWGCAGRYQEQQCLMAACTPSGGRSLRQQPRLGGRAWVGCMHTQHPAPFPVPHMRVSSCRSDLELQAQHLLMACTPFGGPAALVADWAGCMHTQPQRPAQKALEGRVSPQIQRRRMLHGTPPVPAGRPTGGPLRPARAAPSLAGGAAPQLSTSHTTMSLPSLAVAGPATPAGTAQRGEPPGGRDQHDIGRYAALRITWPTATILSCGGSTERPRGLGNPQRQFVGAQHSAQHATAWEAQPNMAALLAASTLDL